MARPDQPGQEIRRDALLDFFARGAELTHELVERLRSAEASNARWAERHAETERSHDDLANLFVASDQLHAARDPGEVVSAICEIVINLIGAECFALYSFEPERASLVPFLSDGRALGGLPEVVLGEGVLGRAVAEGSIWVEEPGSVEERSVDAADPMVVIPLCARGRVLGAISIYKLLAQKSGLTELDHQLFALLFHHASTALLIARLETPSPVVSRMSSRTIDRVTN